MPVWYGGDSESLSVVSLFPYRQYLFGNNLALNQFKQN